MKKVCVVLLVSVMSVVAQAGAITTPYVAGDFQGWNATTDPMVETAPGSNVWTLSFSGLTAGRHEFKIAEYSWANSIPGSGNSWLFEDGDGNITITYDGNAYADGWLPSTDRIGVSDVPGSWTLVGSFGGAGLPNWDNAGAGMQMAAQGGGIYSVTQALTAGTYYWKAVMTGTWDAIGGDNRSVNADNIELTLGADADVSFYVDALTGTVKAEIIPEPATMLLLGLGSLVAIRRKK